MRIGKQTAAIMLALFLAGCASSRFEPPAPRYSMDTGGGTFEPKAKWREGDVRLPAYPDERNLQEFDVKGPTDNRFFIDTTSLSVDPDGVVRYALVVRSNAGSENVAYEGIRCESREWKSYALGRLDRTWSPAREPQWQRVVWHSTNGYRYALYRDYFCPDGYPLRNTRDALAELRRQGPAKDRKE